MIDANDITMTDESGNTAFNLDTNVLTLGEDENQIRKYRYW